MTMRVICISVYIWTTRKTESSALHVRQLMLGLGANTVSVPVVLCRTDSVWPGVHRSVHSCHIPRVAALDTL